MKDPHFLHLIHRIAELSNRRRAALLNRLGKWKLDVSHGEVVLFLARVKIAAMHEIAAAVHRDKSTVTILVRKLAKAGLVSTVPSRTDRRSVLVNLTEKGRSLGRAVLSAHERERRAFRGDLTASEQKTLFALLQRVYDSQVASETGSSDQT